MKKYYLLNFKTLSFEFRVFSNSEEELNAIKELEKDSLTQQYLSDFKQYILETMIALENNEEPIRFTTFVYKDSVLVGILSLLDLGDNLVLSYGICPKQRGNHYGNKILSEVFDYMFSANLQLEKIILYIDQTNIGSIKSFPRSTHCAIKECYDHKTGKKYFKLATHNPYLLNNALEEGLFRF